MAEQHSQHFVVLGAGSWGTALAGLLSDNGYKTILWSKDAEDLPNNTETLSCTDNLESALQQSNTLLVAVPCHAFEELVLASKPFLLEHKRLLWACKGLEFESGRLLHEVAQELLGEAINMGVISGPNFAGEVAQQRPTATTVAANNVEFAAEIASCLHNDWFRAYSSDDLISAQLGGALKNVYAIAAGVCDGLQYGANARAALLTRSMAELMRLGQLMGGRIETFMGLTGMGDLLLTCTDDQSRNRRFGKFLAQGKTVDEALATINQAVEGLRTTKVAWQLAQQHKVDMPIAEQIYRLIYEDIDAKEAVHQLLTRELKSEDI